MEFVAASRAGIAEAVYGVSPIAHADDSLVLDADCVAAKGRSRDGGRLDDVFAWHFGGRRRLRHGSTAVICVSFPSASYVLIIIGDARFG